MAVAERLPEARREPLVAETGLLGPELLAGEPRLHARRHSELHRRVVELLEIPDRVGGHATILGG